MDWTKWIDIIGGLSLFILNLIINNRVMKLQLSFQDQLKEYEQRVQDLITSTMMPRAECMQSHIDMNRRMDAIDRHLENTDRSIQSYFRNPN